VHGRKSGDEVGGQWDGIFCLLNLSALTSMYNLQWWANPKLNLSVKSKIIQQIGLNHLTISQIPIFLPQISNVLVKNIISNLLIFVLNWTDFVHWICTTSKTWYTYSKSVITASYCNTASQSFRTELHAKQQCFHSACS